MKTLKTFLIALAAAAGFLAVAIPASGPANAVPYGAWSPDEIQFLSDTVTIGIVPKPGFTADDIIFAGWRVCVYKNQGRSFESVVNETFQSSGSITFAAAEGFVKAADMNLCS